MLRLPRAATASSVHLLLRAPYSKTSDTSAGPRAANASPIGRHQWEADHRPQPTTAGAWGGVALEDARVARVD